MAADELVRAAGRGDVCAIQRLVEVGGRVSTAAASVTTASVAGNTESPGPESECRELRRLDAGATCCVLRPR